MTSDGQSIERLRDYLRTLNPHARSLLVQELERNLLSEDENAGNELVLQELRRAIRADHQPIPRIGNAARLFFVPLEPFLIDSRADHKRIGRLARVSLEPIWTWISRDLMPAEAKVLAEDVNRALVAGDQVKAEQLTSALHDRAILRMKDAVAAVGADEKSRRCFVIKVGTPRAADDVNTMIAVLSMRQVLADVGKRLPKLIRGFEQNQVDSIKALLDAMAKEAPCGPEGKGKDFFPYSLILLMERLAAPWQLIRIARRAAESDAPVRIAETPYAAAVAIVLSELENAVGELRTELKAGRPVASILKGIHDATRELNTQLDLSVESAWSRQVTAIRAEVSNLLKHEIEATPGAVRRLLRPRPAKEIPAGSVLDVNEVDETERRIEFVEACRHYAGELAVNEVTMRCHSELTAYLETGTRVLLDSLRVGGEADLAFRQSQVDAAIRFCRVIFGDEFAGLLAKAAGVAAQTAAGERKVLRA